MSYFSSQSELVARTRYSIPFKSKPFGEDKSWASEIYNRCPTIYLYVVLAPIPHAITVSGMSHSAQISFSESKSYASEIYNRYPAIHLLRRACAYVSCYYGFWNVPSGITQIHIYAQVYI